LSNSNYHSQGIDTIINRTSTDVPVMGHDSVLGEAINLVRCLRTALPGLCPECTRRIKQAFIEKDRDRDDCSQDQYSVGNRISLEGDSDHG
jgi:hypothetical protein